jgi:hypothetical protein
MSLNVSIAIKQPLMHNEFQRMDWYNSMKNMNGKITARLSILLTLLFLVSCSFEIDYNQYAVVYGIADYNPDGGSGSEDLKYTVNDATAMGALLSKQGYDVTLRTDPLGIPGATATYSQLLADLNTVKSQAGKDDLFVFFFSGHGCNPAPTGGSEPPEGDAYDEGIVLNTEVATKNLYDDELGQLIKAIPCKKKIVILDSCNSGGFIGNDLETDSTPPEYEGQQNGFGDVLSRAIHLYTNYKDRTYDIDPSDALVISASGEREFSYEFPDSPDFPDYGIFTYYLLKTADRGDHNGDGYVTALEAFYYAKEQIEENWNILFDGADGQFSPHVSGGPVDFVLFEAD